ncbi:hypothetical protein CHU95_16065 [Niveispirillum lacus]|uniref:Uncharacterized protein n=1 Tax=Niveispirillum lacus TaxID=1981099 RepID=A0A255YT09_9PROT|nr:hypothetical protein [Niveispirillum lacus]OYQ32319.1 hypothetical protein CHU95_16065 [Niveispirillum lacus]
MAYAYEIGDELPPPPTRAEVEADLADWKARLVELVTTLRHWATEVPGIRCVVVETEKHERKMALVGIHQPIGLPLLLIDRKPSQAQETLPAQSGETPALGQGGMSVWPDARWVIGTRGQVWIQSTDLLETLVDIGKPGAPDWRYTQHGEFLRPLTKESFQSIVKRLQ